MRILISRTDSIGDVALTLPLTGIIKEKFPDSQVDFLGATYTEAVIRCSEHVDEFLNYDLLKSKSEAEAVAEIKQRSYDVCIHVFPRPQIARIMSKAGIPKRIGTTGRIYHWMTCNKLVRFSRKRSDLHESQLNAKLLQPLGINQSFSLSELSLYAGFNNIPPFPNRFKDLLSPNRYHVILHPRSKGSAIEWGLENFRNLAEKLDPEKFTVFITGTGADKESVGQQFDALPANCHNLMGQLSLPELIGFVSRVDSLVAGSTGPLHLAGLLGKVAVGLFSPRRPIHPGRWSPLGPGAICLIYDETCVNCAAGKECNCIHQITPENVVQALLASTEGRS